LAWIYDAVKEKLPLQRLSIYPQLVVCQGVV